MYLKIYGLLSCLLKMIIAIIGKRGCGKTLTMAKIITEELRKGKNIYTNFHINKKALPKIQHKLLHIIDNNFLLNYGTFKLYNCALFIDEIYVYIDSRMSSSKRNRIWSYFINQTRKRDVDMYYTTQFFKQVEVRLRNNTEVFIFPESFEHEQKIFVRNAIYTNSIKSDELLKIKEERFIGNEFFNVYDTDEIIDFGDIA